MSTNAIGPGFARSGFMFLLILIFLTSNLHAQQTDDHILQFRFVVNANQADSLAPSFGSDVSREKLEGTQDLITAIVILVGAAAVSIVADAISDLVWDLSATGVVVDTRTTPVEITTHPSLSPRQLVLVSADETRIFTVSKREEIGPLIDSLIKGLK